MRFTHIDLLRYGKFTDRRIALPPAAQDFHLIVGPNEAGKSTLRSAIQDLLFGIETRSRYNFLHPYPDMRLGAQIEHGGNVLDFIRTKARTKTLQAPDGSALADNVLAPFLGTVERAFFDQMFGLNHDRLVQGGQEILSAANDVGQILFQASAGIGSLGAIRDQLVQEADGLWGPRKSDKRAYYVAVQALEQAQAALKQATISTKDWQTARSAVDALQAQLQSAKAQYEQLAQSRFQLERVRRVAPLLATLQGIEAQRAALGTAPTLPADAAEQLAQAERDLAMAEQARSLFDAQATELSKKLAAVAPDEALLARAADIEALSTTRQQLRNHEGDIARREGEIRLLWQEVQDAARQLGWPAEDVAATEQRLPGALPCAHLDDLLRRHAALTQALAAAQEALGHRQDESQAIDDELAQLPTTSVPTELAEHLAAARALGDVAAQTQRAQAQCHRLQDALDAAVHDLGAWQQPIASLRTLSLPSPEECNALLQRRTAAQTAADATQAQSDTLDSDIETLQLEIAQYRAAHQPVTRDDVTQVRAQRDATWQAIKTGAVPLGDAASGYEQAVVHADTLADQRHDTAREATELQSRQDRLQRMQLQATGLHQRQQSDAQKVAQLEQLWNERMAALGLAGMDLWHINDWRAARERVLSAAAALAQEQAAQQGLAATEASASAALAQALHGLHPHAAQLPLAALVRLADDTLSAAHRAQERRSALATQKARAQAALPDARQRAAQAQVTLDAWDADMAQARALAHLPADASNATVAAALQLFAQMQQRLQRMRETRSTRIDTMRHDLDAFADAAQALASSIAPDIAAQPALEIAQQLDALLHQHAAAHAERQRLSAEWQNAQQQTQAASAQAAQSHARLAPLLRLSGTAENDALRAAIAQSDRLRALTQQQDETHAQLLHAGDGHDQAALAAECAGTDVDAVAARLADNQQQTDAVVGLQNQLSAALASAEASLGQIAGHSAAAEAEAQRQEALAQMGQALERYIQVYTAAKLLRWSIDKFRESRQGPLLARASDVFCGLTQGVFGKLVVDYDSEPFKLMGQRAGGGLVGIVGMSEGTRDQLYLALRLAALELHLQHAAPIPLIADDLFINYDDARAKAGLQALAHLSQSTQVIFLSHHAHLVPVAQSVLGAGLNVVHLD